MHGSNEKKRIIKCSFCLVTIPCRVFRDLPFQCGFRSWMWCTVLTCRLRSLFTICLPCSYTLKSPKKWMVKPCRITRWFWRRMTQGTRYCCNHSSNWHYPYCWLCGNRCIWSPRRCLTSRTFSWISLYWSRLCIPTVFLIGVGCGCRSA
jgi:hypothetical protein